MPSPITCAPNKGFTVLEITISLALIGVIAALGLFVSTRLFATADIESERSTLVTLLMRARSHALASYGGVSHGACYDANEHAYISFTGVYDEDGSREEMAVGNNTQVAGLPTCADGGLLFSVRSATTTPAMITLTQGTESLDVEVNREGFIDW